MVQSIMTGGGTGTPGAPVRQHDHDAEHKRLRRHAHQRSAHRRVPCGSNQPNAPIVTYFAIPDADNNTKNNKWRLVVRWQGVTEAQNGDDVEVDHYVVRIRGYKPDGTTLVYHKSFVAKGTDANGNDPPLEFIHDAVLKRARRYTVQVRAHTTQKCPGAWSTESAQIAVGGSTKPNRIATIKSATNPGARRVEFDWDDSDDPEFDRYKVVVSYSASGAAGSWTQTKTAYTRQSFYRYAIPTAEQGGWFKCVVYVQSEPDDTGTRTDSDVSADSSSVRDAETSGGGNLDALSDVVIGTPTAGKVLRYNGTSWVDATLSPGDLSQAGATSGQYLRWSGSAWVASTITLGQIGASGATNGQFAQWNGTSWVASSVAPADISAGGATAGEYLRWSGSQWIASAVAISGLGQAGATLGNLIRWNGTQWAPATVGTVGGDITLGQLQNVSISGASTGDLLRWNGTSWANTAVTLGQLGNVTISGAETNAVLKWNGSQWVNGRVSLIITSVPNAVAGAVYQSGAYIWWYTGTVWRRPGSIV